MSGDGAKFASTLATAHEKTKAGLKQDPISFAIKQRAVESVGPLDLNNPASLKDRSSVAAKVENRYSLQTISPLSDDESDQLRATLEKAPADQQVQIFRQLKQGLEDRQIKAVASQLARKADPVLVQAMGLSVEAPEAASRILKGRQILRDNKEIMPKGADLKTAQDRMASTLGEAYKHNPAHYSAVSDSAMSIYAFKSWQQRDLSGVIDTTRLEESMKEASGGVLQLGRFGSRYTIQAPRYGATESDFMDLLKRADYSKAKGMKADDIQKQGIFESIGDGRFLVKIGPGYVQSDKGPFVLDLNLPARGAGGALLGGAAGMVR